MTATMAETTSTVAADSVEKEVDDWKADEKDDSGRRASVLDTN